MDLSVHVIVCVCVCAQSLCYCSGAVDCVGGGQSLDRLQTYISESAEQIKAELL